MISHLRLRLAATALTLAAVLPPQATHAQPAAAAAVTLPHVSIVTTGVGSPVLLIPGLACPRGVYDGIAADLARTHRVMLVQVNGFGGDDPGANLRPGILEGIVADLHDYLARNRLSGVAVIGHSMGGLVGLMLAREHPADLNRLMVVDSLPFFAVLMAPPGVDPTPAMVAPQAATMRDRIASAYGHPLGAEAAEAQTRGLALSPAAIARMKEWAAAADPRVTAQAMYEDLTTDLRPDLGAIATPITLVYPYNTGGPTREKADPFYHRQYAAAPHVSYVAIGEAAHMVMLDQPAAFAAAVADFLK